MWRVHAGSNHEGGRSMWGWLPQVYHDILARIIPGAAVILGAVYLRDGPYRGVGYVFRVICEQEHSWVCRIGIGLLGAYLVGLVVGEIGELVAGRLLEHRDLETGSSAARECLDEHNRAAEVTGRAPLEVLPDELPTVDLMSEELSVVDRYAGARLTALRAERRMCLVLALSLFILAVANVFLYTADMVPKRLLVEGILILGILVLWRRSSRLHLRVVKQACHAWLMTIGGPVS